MATVQRCKDCNIEILASRKPYKKCPECKSSNLVKVINGVELDPLKFPEEQVELTVVSQENTKEPPAIEEPLTAEEIGEISSGRSISADVYHDMENSGVMSERRVTVWNAYKKYGPMTCGECFNQLKEEHETGHIPDSNIPARCRELEQLGVLRRLPKRPCGATGKTVTVWEAIDGAVPQEPAKNESRYPLTTELPPLGFDIPSDIESMMQTSGSEMGYSAVSSYLTCPTRSHLRSQFKRLPISGPVDGPDMRKLNAAEYGTFIHALLSIRVVYGQEQMLQALDYYGKWIYPEDKMAASNLLLTYDSVYPLDKEPFEYLGCEVEVYTNIGEGVVRTARYDKIVKYQSGVASLEHKTSKGSGRSAMDQYIPQFLTQTVVWNRNKALVDQHGPMVCVIADQLVKTVTPNVDRHTYTFPENQLRMIEKFLRLPEQVTFPLVDGEYPKFLQNCYGKYQPCEFIPLCWDNLTHLYEQK